MDHYRPYGNRWPEQPDRVWFEVGNVARANKCKATEVAAFLHTRAAHNVLANDPDASHPEGGMMMCVIENNQFLEADHPIHLGCPASWPVVRNNRVSTAERWPQGIAFEFPHYIDEPLLMANGARIECVVGSNVAPAGLLWNGSFDQTDSYAQQPEFWQSFHAAESEADLYLDDRDPFEGTYCVTIVKRTAKNYSGFRYKSPLDLRQGKSYRLSGMARGTPGAKAVLVFMMYADSREYLGYHTALVELSADWTAFSNDFQIKPGTTSVAFEIRAQSQAYTVSYDSLSLTELQ